MSRAATVNRTIAATTAAPPRTGVRKLVNPETRWYAASTGTPRKFDMRPMSLPAKTDGGAGSGRGVRGLAGRGGRWGRRRRSGSGPACRVRVALTQERRPPGLFPQRAGAADQRQGGGGPGDPGHRGEQGQGGGEHGPGQDGRGQGGQ